MGRAKTSTSVSSSIHALPVPRLHLSLSAPSPHDPCLRTFTFHCASIPCQLLPPKLTSQSLSLLLEKNAYNKVLEHASPWVIWDQAVHGAFIIRHGKAL
jgi:hypothetical protein